MIRTYAALLVFAATLVAVASLFRPLPRALVIALPLGAGLFCLGLGSAILYAALTVPSDRGAALGISAGLIALAALNIGAAARTIIRRR